MQIFPFFLAAALMEPALPIYYMSDAQGGIEDSWWQVAHERDKRCEVEVTGNGRFNRITMRGFAPNEIGYFRLANDEYFRMTDQKVKPIQYRFKADETGRFSKIYLPLLYHHQGGTVSVNARGEDCDVSLSFPWDRAEVRIH